MKISAVLEKLHAFHPAVEEERTCDTVKCGNPEQECTGIATAIYASPDVIRKAKEAGVNLLIVHEPTFYSHQDETGWLAGNPVFSEKSALIQEAGLVIFRDHDRIHGTPRREDRERMDLIFYGIMQELGWEKYCLGFENKPLLYQIPETTVGELAKTLIAGLGLNGARIVGNPDTKVRKVFFCEHVNGSARGGREPDREKILEAEAQGYDVLIPLEIVDWTLTEYIRDSSQLGRGKALIEMGHFNTEEPAMRYMAKWLPDILGEEGKDIPVCFLSAGDLYHYISR